VRHFGAVELCNPFKSTRFSQRKKIPQAFAGLGDKAKSKVNLAMRSDPQSQSGKAITMPTKSVHQMLLYITEFFYKPLQDHLGMRSSQFGKM
jgi:hypothetical protein